MDGERLKQVEEIYHAALDVSPEKREAVFNKFCGDDEVLRREVEFLLSFAKSSDSFLETPPESLAAEMFSDERSADFAGTRIRHYKIQKLIGKGGMGEVYLATDEKLRRNVAIKILSADFAKDAERMSRFIQEARAASALNHANIITIYEIGESADFHFIATEYIEGTTLTEYLKQEQIDFRTILEIAIQIASALVSAHEAGIIHRDIKPDNIMIRNDGTVKVLDFGIAKLGEKRQGDGEIRKLGEDDATLIPPTPKTLPGMIMGTPQYMSPEQARGLAVNTQTDVWSFGVLAYLMLTNNLPFQGETTSDVIASILKSEPLPLNHFVPNISPIFEKVILRTFQKNINERPTIGEILSELRNYKRTIENEKETTPFNYRVIDDFDSDKDTDTRLIHTTAKDRSYYRRRSDSIFSQTINKAREFPVYASLTGIAFVSIFIIAGIAIVSKSNLFSNQTDSFQEMKLAKLTYDGTAANTVAVSPDGKFIVYVLKDEEKQTLMVRQIAASTAVERIPAAKVNYTGLAFTPDGNDVYYTVWENDIGTLYDIPVIGGSPRKVLENVDGKVTFSPDGKNIAFVRSRNSIIVADSRGGSERVLARSLPQENWRSIAWNPNGETILTSVFSSAKDFEFLSEISIKDGTEKRFTTTDWQIILSLNWLPDGSGIIFSGRDQETRFSQIWKISYPDGKASRITNDFSTYVDVGLMLENDSLVTVKNENIFNLWVSSTDKPQTAKQITFEQGKDDGASGVAWTPDGKIVYTIRPTGASDLWIADADGSGQRQLTDDQNEKYYPVVSPDGRYIVFISKRTGNPEIWRMDIDGGNPVALTDTPDAESTPNFTPDGKWIVYERTDADKLTTIWKASIDGGRPIQLTETDTFQPSVSPDGKLIACKFGDAMPENSQKIAILRIEGGTPLATPEFPAVARSRVFRWSFDGEALVYLERKNRVSNLWSQPLDGSPPKQLTFIESGQIYAFDFTRDGKALVVSRGNSSSDVVMISNFR